MNTLYEGYLYSRRYYIKYPLNLQYGNWFINQNIYISVHPVLRFAQPFLVGQET